MIKIVVEEIDKIELKFFAGLKPTVSTLLKLHQTVLKLVNSQPGKLLDDLINDSDGMSIRTITSYLKVFLIDEKTITSRAHWPLLLIPANIKPYYIINFTWINNLITELQTEKLLKTLLLGKPAQLLQTERKHKFKHWDNILMRALVNQIFDYNAFCNKNEYNYDAYNLSDDLKVLVCPYCNRSYTSTIITKPDDEKISRPTLDHFFDKANHPLLALSLYNLIPSCSLCNSYLKGSKEFKLTTHLHPYIDGYGNDICFDFEQKQLHKDKSHPSNFVIKFAWNIPTNCAKYRRVKGNALLVDSGNMDVFKTAEIYQAHCDVVGEIVLKADENSPYYARSLKSLFVTMGTTDEEFYRFYFGNYYNEKDFNKRPLAKITKDIVVKLLPEFEEKLP